MTRDYHVGITTVDNPYDYFDDFVGWWKMDHLLGYGTLEKVARIIETSRKFTVEQDEQAFEEAIDEFIAQDFTGLFRKVTRKKGKYPFEELNQPDNPEISD